MKTTQFFLTSLLIALLGYAIPGQADDVDIYSLPVGNSADAPNMLIVLDTAANSNASVPSGSCTYVDGGLPSMDGKALGVEQCTLYNTIYNLPVNPSGTARVNVGIMFYNATGLSCSGVAGGSAGGCLVQKLTPMTAANKTIFLNWIKAWANITSSGEATGQVMQEAWAYYAGQEGISGRDYSTIQPHPQPWQPNPTCGKDYVIFIANAYDVNSTPGDGGLGSYSMTTGGGGVVGLNNAPGVTIAPTNISLPNGVYNNCSSYTMGIHSDSSGLYADEWARYMHFPPAKAGTSPLVTWFNPITTYTIGALGPNCKSDYPALLTSMARHGGGKYFPTSNATGLSQAMLTIFNEVQAVNSVFSSSSLPVSVNTQGTYLNQIFMGMFRPNGNGNPRWLGNLKQYQFIYDPTTKVLQLGDATGAAAISGAGTGFLSTQAASYWTCTNATQSTALGAPYNALPTCATDPAIGFWLNQPSGTGGNFDLPDGEIVEKGGTAQQVRLANLIDNYTTAPGSASNPRKLYTYCPAGTGCNTTLGATANVFDTSNAAITDAMLGTGSAAISSITSAATVLGGGASPGGSGAPPATVSITNLAKAGNTVTATVSPATDVGTKVVVGTQLKISSGATKFDCNPCTVATITAAAGTFTYTNSGGNGTAALPTTASIFSNYFWIYKIANGLPIGQTLTISGCTTYITLNGTVATVAVIPGVTPLPDYIDLAVATSVTGTTIDYGCQYTLNTATVTTSINHGFPTNSTAIIAGATPAGYNGSWTITVTGTNTFTYQYTAAAPLANFSGAGATASSTTTRDALTRWVRGEDNYGDEASLCPPGNPAGVNGCPTPAVNIRPSLHGDVLHSRPVVLNYGGTTGVVVFYGGNDGVYRAINGNQTNPSGSSMPVPGAELWGFIPSEFFGKLKRQHDNSPVLLVPSTPTGIIPAPAKKDYFADGPTGFYQLIDGNGVTLKAYLYLAMRRGGRFIYALDVTDPANPKYLWKKSSADAGFGELGQTWSQPKIAVVKGYANPVLVFGAGYDAAAEDTEPPTADTMGRGIFILDAFTGDLLWNAKPSAGVTSCGGSAPTTCSVAGMNYSIPSDLTLLDRDNDGKIDRMYATDVGGNVWRIDFEPAAGNTPDKWQVEQLAALGCDGGACAAGTSPRKFFYPAEVIATKTYDAVFAGSGDREHPLGSYVTGTTTPTANTSCAVANQVYMLVDLKTGKDGSGQALITQTGISPNGLFNATALAYPGQLSPPSDRGYFITMGVCEKVVNAPLVVAGYVYFGTNTPEPPTTHRCEEPLGEATGYKLQPFTGVLTGEEFNGGGLPPSPVAGVVNIVVNGVVTQVPFCIGCGGGEDQSGNQSGSGDSGCGASALAGCKPPINVTPTRTRTFWYQQNK